MNKSIVLCGVGGQGTVLAAKVISQAAMMKGYPVMSAETIGMAQRGGSVFSHVRYGVNLYCPMIAEGEADVILSFEPAEAVRMLPYLKKEGWLITASHAVKPVTSSLRDDGYEAEPMLRYLRENVSSLMIVDTEEALSKIGSGKVMNTLLLGAALTTGVLGISREDVWQALLRRVPERLQAVNQQALFYDFKQ